MRRSVDDKKANHCSRLQGLNRQLGSEASVLVEQQRYIESLDERLRDESLQSVESDTAEGAGKRGVSAVQGNAVAVRAFTEDLRGRLEKSEASLTEARARRGREAKRLSAEADQLMQQKEATADALLKLKAYETDLVTNLSSLPVDAPSSPESLRVGDSPTRCLCVREVACMHETIPCTAGALAFFTPLGCRRIGRPDSPDSTRHQAGALIR